MDLCRFAARADISSSESGSRTGPPGRHPRTNDSMPEVLAGLADTGGTSDGARAVLQYDVMASCEAGNRAMMTALEL